MAMELKNIPFRPTEEEEEEIPEFFFGAEAVSEEDVEVPYRREEEEEELTPLGAKLSDNALMRHISEMDPVELDADTRHNEISDRSKKAIQWIEKGLGDRGKKMRDLVTTTLQNADHNDFDTMENILESTYTIGEFFQEVPEATADIAFRVGDNMLNAYSALALHGAGLGFLYEDQKVLDDIIPDSENPITKIYKEMGEWYGNYVLAGAAIGKAGAGFSKKDLLVLSPMATYLSTDSEREDYLSQYNEHPVLGRLATTWKEWGADQDMLSPAVVNKFKQAVIEELMGLFMLGGGYGAFKLTMGVAKKGKAAAKKLAPKVNETTEKLASFITERFKIMEAKERLTRFKTKASDYVMHEEGAVRLGFGDDVPTDDFVKMDDLAKGVEEDDFGKTVLFNISEMDINDTNAINKLNIPDAKSPEQIREEVAGALYSLESKLAPGVTLDPKSYSLNPLPKEVIDASLVKYETYLQARKNIIAQGVRKLEFHYKEPKIKAAKVAKEAKRAEDAATPLPEHDDVTFSKKVDARYEAKRMEDYATVTRNKIIVRAPNYRSAEDFKKAVNDASLTPVYDKEYKTLFEKNVANEKRQVISQDVAKYFADNVGLDREEVYNILRGRPQGEPLTNEVVFLSAKIIGLHVDDIVKRIKAYEAKDPTLGMQGPAISDSAVVELMDEIDDLFESIIPSFLAGGSEAGRILNTFKLVGGSSLRRDSMHISMRLQALGGKEHARGRLSLFRQLVEDGKLPLARKVARDGYGHLLDRLANVFIQLRANNLVSSTASLTRNFMSGTAMTGYYVFQRGLQPLVSWMSRRQSLDENTAEFYDYIGLAKGFLPAIIDTALILGKHIKNLAPWKPIQSFFDPQFTALGPESTGLFGRMKPQDVAEKNVSKSFQSPSGSSGAGERMVRFIELMAENVTLKYAGFKLQMASDEVFKTFVSTLHYHLLASRNASKQVKRMKQHGEPLDWAVEYKKILDNPDSDQAIEMMREAMNKGREATFTMPLIPEIDEAFSFLYKVMRPDNTAVRKLTTLIAPFVTPMLNASRAMVTSNLLTGRIHRALLASFGKKSFLDAGQREERLTQEIAGSIIIGSLIHTIGDNRLVTGSPEDDPATDKLRRAAGLSKPPGSIGVPEEDEDGNHTGVVKWYDVSKIDIIGRMIILAKNISRVMEKMSTDEMTQSVLVLAQVFAKAMDPEVTADLSAVLADAAGSLGKPLPGEYKRPQGDRLYSRMKNWAAKVGAEVAIPFYSFWKEQRKTNNPSVLQMGGGTETFPMDEYYDPENDVMLDQLDKGVGMAEIFVNELDQAFGKSDRIPKKLNQFAEPILIPYHEALFDVTYEMPDVISVLLESAEEKAWNIPGLRHLIPQIEGEITNRWVGFQHTIGYDEDWLGEGGIGEAVLKPEGRHKLDQLAENIISFTQSEHPNIITKENRQRKLMQTRIFLEIEGLKAAEERQTKKRSTITTIMPSDRITVRANVDSKYKDSITLHPRDMNKVLELMNSRELFDGMDEKDKLEFGVTGTPDTYTEALYKEVTTEYGGNLMGTDKTPLELFGILRKISRKYSKRAKKKFQEDNSVLFDELQNSLDQESGILRDRNKRFEE